MIPDEVRFMVQEEIAHCREFPFGARSAVYDTEATQRRINELTKEIAEAKAFSAIRLALADKLEAWLKEASE